VLVFEGHSKAKRVNIDYIEVPQSKTQPTRVFIFYNEKDAKEKDALLDSLLLFKDEFNFEIVNNTTKNINNCFETIKLLLMGTDDNMNVAGSLFNLLKEGVYTKLGFYNMAQLIDESKKYDSWNEPEWGFPKGRRNYQETDYECALREFSEETGYQAKKLKNVHNILPFEEIFTGSNYKSYKHKYYLMYMKYEDTNVTTNYQIDEVSKMAWKDYDDCISSMRTYNLEKMRLITNIHTSIQKYKIFNG
jgi:ADP-ribose pyrophosphatase YjhB (NUDIX family)